MPYVFPYEKLFVLGVGVLILGLLVVRVRLARRRRTSPAVPVPAGKPDEAGQDGIGSPR